MRMLRYVLAVLALCLLSVSAQAATCYWVGGTGNWDNSNVASWSSATGGSASTCTATGGIPKNAGDVATFDGSSGGGTVTVCGTASANCPTSSGLISIATINTNAFTGTVDFATRNPNVTLSASFLNTGGATRTVSLGSGTYTLGNGGVWNWITVGACTCTTTSANIVLTATTAQIQFFGGAHTYASLTLTANTTATQYSIEPGNTANNTFTACTFNAPFNLQLRANTTQTCTGGFTVVGSSASIPISIETDSASSGTVATLAVGSASTCSYCSFRGITGATSAITATNSFNLGSNGGTLSITGPTGGGGGFIIGGG